MLYLLVHIAAIKDDGDVVRRVAVAIDQLDNELLASIFKIPRPKGLERSCPFDYVVAIDQDFATHNTIFLFAHLLTIRCYYLQRYAILT